MKTPSLWMMQPSALSPRHLPHTRVPLMMAPGSPLPITLTTFGPASAGPSYPSAWPSNPHGQHLNGRWLSRWRETGCDHEAEGCGERTFPTKSKRCDAAGGQPIQDEAGCPGLDVLDVVRLPRWRSTIEVIVSQVRLDNDPEEALRKDHAPKQKLKARCGLILKLSRSRPRRSNISDAYGVACTHRHFYLPTRADIP
jgi:hypothetical protein